MSRRRSACPSTIACVGLSRRRRRTRSVSHPVRYTHNRPVMPTLHHHLRTPRRPPADAQRTHLPPGPFVRRDRRRNLPACLGDGDSAALIRGPGEQSKRPARLGCQLQPARRSRIQPRTIGDHNHPAAAQSRVDCPDALAESPGVDHEPSAGRSDRALARRRLVLENHALPTSPPQRRHLHPIARPLRWTSRTLWHPAARGHAVPAPAVRSGRGRQFGEPEHARPDSPADADHPGFGHNSQSLTGQRSQYHQRGCPAPMQGSRRKV